MLFDRSFSWSIRLAASIFAEENGFFSNSASSFAGATLAKEESGDQSILVSLLPVYITWASR